VDNTKRVLTPEEVAQELGCCRKTIYAELKAGKIPSVKIGDKWLIPVVAFETWLKECNQSRTGKVS
jgi:excisionase family DNA binding protein